MNENTSLMHLVGQSIGTYLIEEQIEQRKTEGVYIARSTLFNRLCRLHIVLLSSTLLAEERIILLGRFQHQTREIIHVLMRNEMMPQHPHLLPLIDAGHTQDALYLVAPSVTTKTLTAMLDTQGPMDVLTAGQYLDQLASALEYAHQHALIHGDLTTDEVLLLPERSCMIADLGIMQILELSQPGQLRNRFRPSAAPAPEQLLGQAVHTSTDVYALGAILYRMLTGHRIFQGDSFENMPEQYLHAPVPSLATQRRILAGRTDVTAALDRLLAAALAKNPQQRIQNPAELANAYHQIVAPNDRARTPVRSPLAEAIVVPLPEPVESAGGTHSKRYPRGGDARTLEARRRALILLGGGVVTTGVLACVASRVLRGGGSTTAITTNGATTITSVPGSGQTTGTPGSPTSGSTGGNVIAHASAVPVNSAMTFPNPNADSPQPGVLVHLENGQFVAFDSACTHHASCAVQYVSQDKLLECPCHGAEFDPTDHASVVQGPADRPLAPIAITVHPDGTITAG